MQRVVGAARELAIDRDQVLHRRDLRRQHDAVARKADFFRALRGQQRRLHHRLARDGARVARRSAIAAFSSISMGQQFLVERAPVRADAHGLAVPDRPLDDGAELAVLLLLEADVAGVDAVFVERFGAGRMVGEQLVADVMEVADERHAHAHLSQLVPDVRHGRRRLVAIDRDAHDLGAGAGQRRDLARRSPRHRRCRCWSSTGRRWARRRRP